MQEALDQYVILQTMFNGGVTVMAPDGTAIADAPAASGRKGVNYSDVDIVRHAMDEGRTSVGKPVVGRKLKAPTVGMGVPIRDAQGKVIGVLTGATNLGKPNFLEQMANGVYGKTGGYMLVAPQYRLVVTATDPRRIMEVLPPLGASALVDRFVGGYEGFGVGLTPRGEEVLASARKVPLAGWYVAAALPTAEAFAPVRRVLQQMLWATVALTLLAGGLTWWLIRRQLAPMLEAARSLGAMVGAGYPAEPLRIVRPDEVGLLIGRFNQLLETLKLREEALAAGEAFKGVVLNSVGSNIAVLDRNGVIVAVNEPWLRFARANSAGEGGPAPRTGVGENYLDACEAAKVHPQEGGADAGAGIRNVLEGRATNFELEYRWHAPDGEHWFRMVATPLRGGRDGVVVSHSDVSAAKLLDAEQRIAAIAFEGQEAMLVIDAERTILRVNQSFTAITGYSAAEVEGTRSGVLRSAQHSDQHYEALWRKALLSGNWTGELWYRRKNGSTFLARTSITAVLDAHGQASHYVGSFVDVTGDRQREDQRLRNEAAHRGALVREVHHRIKNNLQGIVGMLSQHARRHPEVAEPLKDAIAQMQSVSVIHGLHGRAGTTQVRLCELVNAIADQVQSLWRSRITLDVPSQWEPCVIAEGEAVPIALILNEVITNAVKHCRSRSRDVRISLHRAAHTGAVQVRIANQGQLAGMEAGADTGQAGLTLVQALMPGQGARLAMEQRGDTVLVQLEFSAPTIVLESVFNSRESM